MFFFGPFPARALKTALLLAVLMCGGSHSAHAALVFCNRTQGAVDAALGYRQDGDWNSEGWWRIEPGQCARVFGKPLTERFYFYYATALVPQSKDKSPFVWAGKYRFCTDNKAFHVEGDIDCNANGYRAQGFRQIDIGTNTHDYTLDFKDNGN